MLPHGNIAPLLYKGLIKNDFFPKVALIGLLFCGTILTSKVVNANVETPGDESLSILTRQNPAYDPLGMRIGAFTLYPSISTGLSYNDNVYATDAGKVHDLIFTTRPSLNINSDFVRHSISASFSAEDGLYRNISSEDYTDYSASLGARFDIAGQTSMPLSFSYEKQHIRRGAPDDRAGDEPTTYHLIQSTAGLVHSGHTLAMKAIAGIKRYVYDNVSTLTAEIDNGDRDMNDYSLYTSVGMAEEAVFAPYVYSNLRSIDYDRNIDNDGYNRDAFEYEGGVGSIVNLSRVTRASFNVGYLGRDMDDTRFEDISALTYGLNLIWEPSTLAAFKLQGRRTIGESTIENAGASIDSNIDLSMEYEMFVNFILAPRAGYTFIEYEGVDKEVVRKSAGLDATYKMNRNVWANASYRYTDQTESGSVNDFDEYTNNIYFLSLKLQF